AHWRLVRGAPWFFREPPCKRLVTTVAWCRCFLAFAAGRTCGTADTDMEVRVVAPNRANLAQPGSIARNGVAKLLLDAGMDQHALNVRIACGALEQRGMGWRPLAIIDM